MNAALGSEPVGRDATKVSGRPRPPLTSLGRVVGLAAALATVVAVIVLAFSWPAVTSDLKDLPVAIAGPGDTVTTVETAVDENADGAIALERIDDRDAAIAAIERREVYGAIVLGEEPAAVPEVLIATAANPTVAQTLTGLAGQLQQQVDEQIRTRIEEQLATLQQTLTALASGQVPPGGAPGAPTAPGEAAAPGAEPGAAAPPQIPVITVEVTDVVPLADTDPRGTGLTAAMFPLVLGGMLGGIALSLLVVGAVRRVVGVLLYAAFGGVVLTGILQGWYGALQGDFWINAAAMALALAAIAAPITGFAALIGRTGIGLGAALFVLVANPISAATIPIEFLAEPWGAVGQWFPPGAAATLLRSLSYFPAADTTFPWLVLASWTLGGILLSLIGHFRTTGTEADDTPAAVATADAAPREAERVPA